MRMWYVFNTDSDITHINDDLLNIYNLTDLFGDITGCASKYVLQLLKKLKLLLLHGSKNKGIN